MGKLTDNQWEVMMHWLLTLVGGFMGVYAVLLHAANFTANYFKACIDIFQGENYYFCCYYNFSIIRTHFSMQRGKTGFKISLLLLI